MTLKTTELAAARSELDKALSRTVSEHNEPELMKFLVDMNRDGALLFHWDVINGKEIQVWSHETGDRYKERASEIEHDFSATMAEIFLDGHLEFFVDGDQPPKVLFQLRRARLV